MSKASLARLLERLPGFRVIWNDTRTEPYLLRVYLVRVWRRRLPGIFLHWFFRGDEDRELHNHPWKDSVSVILWGGYREEWLGRDGVVRTRRYGLGALNRIGSDDFHRVALVRGGCLTLFIAGERTQSWGFMDPVSGVYEDSEDRDVRVFGAPQVAPD